MPVVLTSARAAAGRYLLSSARATVRRTTGRTVQDESTGREVPEWVDVHTDIPFRRKRSGGTRTVVIGGVEMQLAVMDGEFPAGTEDLRDGDMVDVTSGEHVGDVWRLIETRAADLQTRLRFPMIEAQRPSEWT